MTDAFPAAEAQAREAGLALVRAGGGVQLTDGNMSIRGDFSRMANRVKPANLNRELLVKAAKVKGVDAPIAVDATAGLGEDSLLLAAAGFTVRMYERNPVIAALLQDAIERAAQTPGLSEAASRMHLSPGDSIEALQRMGDAQGRPDVVLLDPMFPSRQKSAAVKKKLQLLQRLEQPCEDERALLDAAFAAHPRKVVVKRPLKGPYLAGARPDYSLEGKAIRFDCFSLSR